MSDYKIPSISSYSPNELEDIKKLSPALTRYLSQAKSDNNNLRQLRLKTWIDCAAAALSKSPSADIVCKHWSLFTDSYLSQSWKDIGLNNYGAVLFAMGKLGAEELNLSSDIDLIVVTDGKDDATIEKLVRHWVSQISQPSVDGPGYRVDMDLRPGGRFGPLVSSVLQLEDYYWVRGASWERLALIRTRAIVGDSALREKATQLFQKFTFRKFLDFRLLEDLKSLRVQIQEHKSAERTKQFDLKLSSGGIRDIELFVNALQVIHGGKDLDFRSHSTSTALDILGQKKALPEDQVEFLKKTYWYYRSLENYTQSIDDRQTHSWHEKHGPSDFIEIKNLSIRVDSIVSELLGKPNVAPGLPASEEEQIKWLISLGFSDERTHSTWREIMSLTALSTRSQDDEINRQRVLYKFAQELSKGLDSALGLANLLDFIRATRAKAGFFSLLLHEPRIISDLAGLFSTSPFLGHILSGRPELLDSFVLKAVAEFSDELDVFLSQAHDRRLLAEISLASEFFRTKDFEPVCAALSDTADLITQQLLTLLKNITPNSSLSVIPLGKWAAHENGFRSDLDFIFFTEKPPNESDQKIARRFISHITESRKAGSIYPVDMRLRPSGKSGPVLVSEEQLLNYFSNKAEAWERQSYLRLRVETPFKKKLHDIIFSRGFSAEDLLTLRDIRQQLYRENDKSIDFKYIPGGLLDIEFSVQISIIKNNIRTDETSTILLIDELAKHLEPWAKQAGLLKETYAFLRSHEQLFQLVTQRTGSELKIGTEDSLRLGKLIKSPDSEFFESILIKCKHAHLALKALDPIWAAG
jgi:glutamate-ammonia-ligase adenylyltransferase